MLLELVPKMRKDGIESKKTRKAVFGTIITPEVTMEIQQVYSDLLRSTFGLCSICEESGGSDDTERGFPSSARKSSCHSCGACCSCMLSPDVSYEFVKSAR